MEGEEGEFESEGVREPDKGAIKMGEKLRGITLGSGRKLSGKDERVPKRAAAGDRLESS